MIKFIKNLRDTLVNTWSSGPLGKAIVLGLGFLIMIGCCNGVYMSITQRARPAALPVTSTRRAPAATTTQAIKETPTNPVPTATDPPAPTETVNTSTPLPSATLIPTLAASETPTPDATRIAYADNLAQTAFDFSEYLDQFSKLNIEASQDVSLLVDETWLLKTLTVLAGLRKTADKFVEYPALLGCEATGLALQGIQSETHIMVEQYAKGVDDLDPDLITSSLQHMQKATNFAEQSLEGLKLPSCMLIAPSAPALIKIPSTPVATQSRVLVATHPTATKAPTRVVTAAPTRTRAASTATTAPVATATSESNSNNGTSGSCDPSYPNVCIPPYPPDLNCADVPYVNFTVLQPDPHGFDRNKDGIGCEKN